jgi:hypothetical protein
VTVMEAQHHIAELHCIERQFAIVDSQARLVLE